MDRLLQRWFIKHGALEECGRIRREFLGLIASRSDAASDLDGSQVIFGELVANALEHGSGDVTISLFKTGTEFVLRVHDEGRGFELIREAPDLGSLRGRGLYFVYMLAKRVEVSGDSDGSTIEAILPLRLQTA